MAHPAHAFAHLVSPNSLWTHVKTGSDYRVLGVALGQHSDDPEGPLENLPQVIYRNVYGMLFVRPLAEFIEKFQEKTQ